MFKQSVAVGVFLVVLLCVLTGASQASAAEQWHNKMMRSAWERDQGEIGGDGTQIPRSMVWSPKNNYQTVFFGVDTAGVYRSDDGGQTWTSKMKGINVPFIKSMAIDPVNEDVIYAIAAYERWDMPQMGLYISTDNGENWTQQQYFKVQMPLENSHNIAIDPTSYNATLGRCEVVYVGTNDGLYKTVNGGTTYVKIGASTIAAKDVTSINVHPTDPAIVTVATVEGVFRSLDAGASFTDISAGLPTFDEAQQLPVVPNVSAMAVDPTDPYTLYAAYDDPFRKNYKLFKKAGAGNWTELTGAPKNPAPGQVGRFYELMVHPAAPNKLLLGVEWGYPLKGPFYSDDYGETWVDSNAGKVIEDRFNLGGGDIANFIFFRSAFAPKPDDPDVWLAGLNFGAIFKTEDSTATWTWSNTNYGGARFSKFAFNPNDARHIVMGGTDMGIVASFDGGQSFKRSQLVRQVVDPTTGGEIGINVTTVGIDPDSAAPETARVIASTGGTNPNLRGVLQVSTDGGRNFSVIDTTYGYQASNIMWHPQNHDYIYAGGHISRDDGVTWQSIVDSFRLTETFEKTAAGSLPAGWTTHTYGQNTSTAAVYASGGSKRLRFEINQTSGFGSLPVATYGAKTLSFTQTPITATAVLDPGSSPLTQQAIQIDNDNGRYITVFIQNNGDGTYKTMYQIRDGSYDSGNVLIMNNTDAKVATRVTVAKDYIIINSGKAIKIDHTFSQTTGFKLKLGGRSNATGQTVYTYADDATFSMLPIDVIGYAPDDPETLYAHDAMNVYKSTDFGVNWTRMITHVYSDPNVPFLYSNYLTAAEMNKAGTQIYMGHRNGVYIYDIASNTETFKSTADGFVNNQSGTFDITHIAIDPNDDQKIYAGEFNLLSGNGEWVFRSDDGGETWTPMKNNGFFGNGKVWGLDVDDAGRVFVGSDHGTFWYGDDAAPAVPADVKAVPDNGAIRLTWGAAEGAVTYQVKRSLSASGPYTVLQGGVLATSYTDAAVASGNTYYYKISAGNLGGEGGESAAISASPWLYEALFDEADGALSGGWTYTGAGASGASIADGKLTHSLNQTSAWGATSKVTLADRRYEFYSAPLYAEAYLHPGATAIGQSGLQLSDGVGNYTYVIQKTDRGILYRIKDGTDDSGEVLIGEYAQADATITLKLAPDGLTVYRGGSVIREVPHEYANRRDYKLELLGRSGSTGSDIRIYADAVRVWKDTFADGFPGVNGSIPEGWTNATSAGGGQAAIEDGKLRMTIVQPSPFSKHTVLRKTNAVYRFDTDTLNAEAYLKADSHAGATTQIAFGFGQKDQWNLKQFYIILQSNGYVGYRIYEATSDPHDVDDTTETRIDTFPEAYGVFRLEAMPTQLNIYRNGVLIKEVPWQFTNLQDYQLTLTARAATASAGYYVTVDDVNIYYTERDAEQPPVETAALLTAPAGGPTGQTFDAIYTLSGVTGDVYGQDVKLTYDPLKLELLSTVGLSGGLQLLDTRFEADGVRVLAARTDGGTIVDGQQIRFSFRVKPLAAATTANLQISRATLADSNGLETALESEPVALALSVPVVQVPGDLNGDQTVSIGDIAIVAAAYGRTSADPLWLTKYSKADVVADGVIDLLDLVYVAVRVP